VDRLINRSYFSIAAFSKSVTSIGAQPKRHFQNAEIFCTNPNLPWNMNGISQNSNITLETITVNPSYAWNFIEANPNIDLNNSFIYTHKNIIHNYVQDFLLNFYIAHKNNWQLPNNSLFCDIKLNKK
jgi:hypothetical protein